jgi:hypothetical protein
MHADETIAPLQETPPVGDHHKELTTPPPTKRCQDRIQRGKWWVHSTNQALPKREK